MLCAHGANQVPRQMFFKIFSIIAPHWRAIVVSFAFLRTASASIFDCTSDFDSLAHKMASSYKSGGVTETKKNENKQLLPLRAARRIDVSRLSARELCKIFALHCARLRAQKNSAVCSQVAATMNDLEQIYERLCAEAGECAVHSKWLESEFSARDLHKLLAPRLSDGCATTRATPSNQQKNTHKSANVDSSLRRSMLVPLSGGVASVACAWWAMQQSDVDVYFCYLVGVDRACIEREVLCIGELMRYARDNDGKPLFGSEKCRELDALARQPHARIKVLPMPTQPYTLKANRRVQEWRSQRSGDEAQRVADRIKHHPLTYALMYRQLLNAAQAFGCHEIAWGVFGSTRTLIAALQPLFDSKVHVHRNWFPFERRDDALRSLLQAACVSESVWRNAHDPLSAQSEERDNEDMDNVDNDDEHDKKSAKAKKGAASKKKAVRRIVQASCAALMPDLAQYVQTCGKSAHSATSSDKETEAEESAADYLKRRRKQVVNLNWCGECCDCVPWSAATKSVLSPADERNNANCSTNHTLRDAYTLLLAQSNLPTYAHTSAVRKRRAGGSGGQKRRHNGASGTKATKKVCFASSATTQDVDKVANVFGSRRLAAQQASANAVDDERNDDMDEESQPDDEDDDNDDDGDDSGERDDSEASDEPIFAQTEEHVDMTATNDDNDDDESGGTESEEVEEDVGDGDDADDADEDDDVDDEDDLDGDNAQFEVLANDDDDDNDQDYADYCD